jgi:hypothetical protein
MRSSANVITRNVRSGTLKWLLASGTNVAEGSVLPIDRWAGRVVGTPGAIGGRRP